MKGQDIETNTGLKKGQDIEKNTGLKKAGGQNETKSENTENTSGDTETTSRNTETETSSAESSDYSFSDSNPQEIRVIAMHIEWNIYKDKSSILGKVVMEVTQLDLNARELILDMHESLKIIHVMDRKSKLALDYTVEARSYEHKMLVIDLSLSFEESSTSFIIIKYKKTSLDDLYYDNRQDCIMFTNFHYLRGRHLFPCQDTPTNKILFSATVHLENRLEFLMSAKHVKTKGRPDSKMKAVYFVNPHPIPVYAIGFVVGKFQIKELRNNVKLYSGRGIKDYNIVEKIPDYIQNISELVGGDPWREHQVVILKDVDIISTFPYLYILSPAYLSPEDTLRSLAYNWFRSTITISDINDLWLHEAFSLYVARRLAGFISDEDMTERKVHGAATKYRNVSIAFSRGTFSNEDSVDILAERAWLCLLILEHYGGTHGQFDKLLQLYFQDNKFKYANLQTMANLVGKCLNFGDDKNIYLSRDHKYISNLEAWVEDGAPIPREFSNRTLPHVEIDKTIQWLQQQMQELKEQKKKIAINTEPLVYFKPKFVNHRVRKLLLVHRLSLHDKGTLNSKLFEALARLGMNCSKDEKVMYEFMQLSIKHRQIAQLKAIKEFVTASSDIEHLIDIMRCMIDWDRESSKVKGDNGCDSGPPLRRDIIRICDDKVEQLLILSEKKKKKVPTKKEQKNKKVSHV